MKRLDPILTRIARDHLGITTLRARKSDRLDFHEVAVWQIKSALKAALEEGARTGPAPAPFSGSPIPFDAYEIHGMKRIPCNGPEEEPVGRVIEDCETVPDDEAEFWSLFGHIPGQGIDCIGDFKTREHAEEVFARITGRSYTEATRPAGRQKP